MKKKIEGLCSLFLPIGIIVTQILIIIDTNSENLKMVCGIIIGMQIMLIVDGIIAKKKK